MEFAYAMERHIPVLPLAQESGLEALFDRVCGDLQMLDKTVRDDTVIRYEEKLEKFLSSVLIGDALASKARAAFDTYIFLSYRKKDRRYAQELMRLIHRNDFCRDIAIWYDEFLIPGEDFNDAIASALQKSGLFAMAVTPDLLEDGNYVMRLEHPKAVEAGELILPVELEQTDQEGSKRKYEGIPDCTDAHDGPALSQVLLDAVRRLAIQPGSSSTPEHDYFIGLAYLGAQEMNREMSRLISPLEKAAFTGSLKASWHGVEGISPLMRDMWGRIDGARQDLARTQSVLSCARLGDLSRRQGRLDEAEAAYQKCLKHCKRLKGETDREVTGLLALRIGYEGLGDLRMAQGRWEGSAAKTGSSKQGGCIWRRRWRVITPLGRAWRRIRSVRHTGVARQRSGHEPGRALHVPTVTQRIAMSGRPLAGPSCAVCVAPHRSDLQSGVPVPHHFGGLNDPEDSFTMNASEDLAIPARSDRIP